LPTELQKPNTIMKNKQEKGIDPNILIDAAVSIISDEPPKTFVGRLLRWIKKINVFRNTVGIEIKKPLK